jgi:hypothetical protein
MNYSQRKNLERLMERAPDRREPDPFRLPTLVGLQVIEATEYPKYELPKEVMPGVPWPPGFRDEINRWSRSFLGTTSLIPNGTAYVIGGSYIMMRPSDVVKIINVA